MADNTSYFDPFTFSETNPGDGSDLAFQYSVPPQGQSVVNWGAPSSGMGATMTDLVQQFRAVNQNARFLYQSGQKDAAESNYSAAVAIDGQLGGGSDRADDLAFTRAILDGDPRAFADWRAGKALLSSAQSNQPTVIDRIIGGASTNPIANAWETAASTTQGFVGGVMRFVGIKTDYGNTPNSGRQKQGMDKGNAAAQWGVPLLGVGVVAYLIYKFGKGRR